MNAQHRLSLVVYQDVPGMWVGRGLEHDLTVEGRSVGETVRALLRLIEAHAAYDARHDRLPLSAFRSAPQCCWNAFSAGAPIPLTQLGVVAPPGWDIAVAIARHRPRERGPALRLHHRPLTPAGA